jgi:predicted HTH transcriptional regulator
LRETWRIECKLAQGRDGQGALPHDVWETYSAFANTDGGDIFLGLRELGPGSYELAGIPEPRRVVEEILAGAADPKVVSVNLLCMDDIGILTIDGRSVIQVSVPRAPDSLRPVYINGNVFNGSYVRDRSFDVRLSEDRVRRILAKVKAQLLSKA